MYTHTKNYITAGQPIGRAKAALVMLHGRGGEASNMLSLVSELDVSDMAVYAPQATRNSWYPYSFMAPDIDNQPAMDSALSVVSEVVDDIVRAGISAENIFFLGFSQGACLVLEFISRNAKRYGGAVAFTGGLIGGTLSLSNYNGDFAGTRVLITTGDPDPHVPLSRVTESVLQLQAQGADVKLNVDEGRPHMIARIELELANEWVFSQTNVI